VCVVAAGAVGVKAVCRCRQIGVNAKTRTRVLSLPAQIDRFWQIGVTATVQRLSWAQIDRLAETATPPETHAAVRAQRRDVLLRRYVGYVQ
jgi:hypothetical protein